MSADHDLPVDPDVDPRDPPAGWDVLAVIALGGALGSLALGVLLVLVAEVTPGSRYLRPFAGVGLLGGWTTFSTYALDTRSLLAHDRTAAAVLYVGGSLALGLVAVVVGLRVTRRVVA
jgi:CrcB protein